MTDKKKSSLFVGHFGQPGNVPPPGDPISITTMPAVPVDRISFYEGNPRSVRNPKYGEIKESIRTSGLDNPLPISRRSSDPPGHYIIYKGGNTRLEIIKELWEETKDQRFYHVRCEFHPFVSETDALISHLRENDLRGDMTFIDRALAVQKAKAQLEVELGETLSLRKLEAAFKERGFPISNGLISRMEYAAGLHPHTPKALQAGLGRPQIERLQKLEKAALAVWRYLGDRYATDQVFRGKVFAPALAGSDSAEWAYEAVEAAVRLRLLANLPQGTDTDSVQASLKRALEGKELAVLEPAVPTAQPTQPTQPEPASAYAPLDQHGLFSDAPAATLTPAQDTNGSAMDGVDVQFPMQVAGGLPAGSWDGEADDGLEGWMPQALRKEVLVEGSGRWLDKLKLLRERNHALAVKLSNAYVPKGEDAIAQVDFGYGFLVRDTFDPVFLKRLRDRAESDDQDALLSFMHVAHIWWLLVEVCGLFSHVKPEEEEEGDPSISGLLSHYKGDDTHNCPSSLLTGIIPDGSILFDPELLHFLTPDLSTFHTYRLQTWWLKLTDGQFGMLVELIGSIRTISDIVLEHARETDGASVWEVSTGSVP